MCLGLVGWFVSWNENMKRSTTDGDGPLATVDKKHQIVVQDNLHLAQVDPIDISLLGRETRVISSDSNVQYPSFYFETGTSWVDISGGTLSFKFKLVKANGGNLTDALNLAPANNVGMSIFRLVEFEINNRSLNKLENNALAPLCHILHLLNYDDTDQGTFLPLQGWAKDTGTYDSVDVGGDNESYTARYNGVRQSRTVYYEVPLKHFPFFALDKPIPPRPR